MRIELTTKAWEAFVLPLNYARIYVLIVSRRLILSNILATLSQIGCVFTALILYLKIYKRIYIQRTICTNLLKQI